MGSNEQAQRGAHEHVMRLTQRLVAEANQVSSAFVVRHRLHATDVNALIRVFTGQENDECTTAGWLGEELGLSSGAVTAVVDRLERAGTLRRVRDERDRRRVLVENTTAGRALVDTYYGPIRRRSEEVMNDFTTSELEVVSRYLAATAAAMTAHRESLIAEHADEANTEG